MSDYDRYIHFGYVIFGEGKKHQMTRVLVGMSLESLEAQAANLSLRLRGEDYCSIHDIEDFGYEAIAELEYARSSQA